MHIAPRRDDDVPLGIRESIFATPGDHIAYFWRTDEDFAAGVQVLEVGLREGDSCVVFGHLEANEKVLTVLRGKGVAVDDLLAEGRLAVLGGRASGEAMLAEIAATFTSMLDRGSSCLRLLGNIGWEKAGWPAEGDILVFEANVTRAIAGLPCIVVCMYDVRSLQPHLIVQAGFALHPFTLSAGSLDRGYHP